MLGKFAICFFSIPGASSAPGSASTVMESSRMVGHLFSVSLPPPLTVVVCRAHLSNWPPVELRAAVVIDLAREIQLV